MSPEVRDALIVAVTLAAGELEGSARSKASGDLLQVPIRGETETHKVARATGIYHVDQTSVLGNRNWFATAAGNGLQQIEVRTLDLKYGNIPATRIHCE